MFSAKPSAPGREEGEYFLFLNKHARHSECSIDRTKFLQHAALLGIRAGDDGANILFGCQSVKNAERAGRVCWWLWKCLKWSLAIVTSCLHSSSHCSSELRRGHTSSPFRRYWCPETCAFAAGRNYVWQHTLQNATQAEEQCGRYHIISATTTRLKFGI